MSSFDNKYRVHEVAKDFNTTSKAISEILTQYAAAPKNHMQVLEDGELSVIFEYLTQHNQCESAEDLTKVPVKKAEPKKEPPRQPQGQNQNQGQNQAQNQGHQGQAQPQQQQAKPAAAQPGQKPAQQQPAKPRED